MYILTAQVVSTTCQYETDSGSLDWMTCPLNKERETPLTFRQFKDDLENSQNNQKFCCGEISQRQVMFNNIVKSISKQYYRFLHCSHRFCCSLEEKLLEMPDFDPSKGKPYFKGASQGKDGVLMLAWYEYVTFFPPGG